MKILDACCGSRLFWFDKECNFATYMDIREEEYEIYGKKVNVKPDVVADFRDMPFADCTYDLVVFDPPHLKWAGQKSIMKGQYGQLDKDNWPDDIKRGMAECMRVIKPNGTVIFKWNENQVKLKEVLKAIEPFSPLFGNKRSQTHWLIFNKQVSYPTK
ncbi:hypothetical protein A5886_002179 [Enterococcus sp. 8G7_MSG3316]|uniref:Uncharacterized protein n=1 Tax=Candidatus Enterococcus testudinis TaxID=1834191 RepID=A0A242A849_9ENTE|nr:class I SAM-dependent methyltransferase [Enterococcus sp. 8G7_MSG3316]OTN77099.1 hypothetical protein A5886_002179 [Enterococcus sp. 8G7_MSG3316]